MSKHLVLQTDFGLQDGAVSTMYGVAYQVSDDIVVSDLTHGITPVNIFEGSFRLAQTVKYWRPGTVFVSVVDPGVGSNRLSIVAKLKTGHFVVTPDNGTITHLAELYGIEEIRIIDESIDRLPGSEKSATFHGRDIYVYNGARLASGEIMFAEIGEVLPLDKVVKLPLHLAKFNGETIEGNIDITDVNFGSLWTNIPEETWTNEFHAVQGKQYRVRVYHQGQLQYEDTLPYVKTFADVQPGESLIYINSVYTVALAVHTGNFSTAHNVGAGPDWSIDITPAI